MASEIKVDTISEKTSANGVTIDSLSIKDGGLVASGNIDVNGNNLVLDANANTYLDAGTDDTIKFYVAGAHDLTISANAINVLSGTTLTIDSGATIANSGTATGFSSADPASADGDTLGTASAEWSDLYLADGGVVYFGNDQEIKLTHVADTGLALKHTATADDKPVVLTLQTGETDMAANDVIGKIAFQAPDEGTGTDAILVAAAIQAVAEGDFSSSSNATSLQFMTGSSEAAAEKMRINSSGSLFVGVTSSSGFNGGVWKEADGISMYRAESTAGNAALLVYSDEGSTGANKGYWKNNGGIVNYQSNDGDLSDERLKKNIVDTPSCYDTIKALKVRNYKYKTDSDSAKTHIGLIAQEAEAIDSSLVNTTDGLYGFEEEQETEKYRQIYNKDLYFKMLKALQEAITKIETLETKVTALEG